MILERKIGNATLYRGKCEEVLQSVDLSFDAIITDPPYSSGGMTRSDRMLGTAAKYVQDSGGGNGVAHNLAFSGDNRDSRSWAFWVSAWLSVLQTRMTPGGYAMVFTDWRQLPALTDAFQGGGFIWRGLVPWDKTESARAPHTGYFRHQCEYVVWGSNGPLKQATHGGPWPGFIRERVNPSEKFHMTGKPIRLMEELVRAVPPGSTIIDPFMGSGSTGIAALALGYRFIGIELTEHYFETACDRIAAVQDQQRIDMVPLHEQPTGQASLVP